MIGKFTTGVQYGMQGFSLILEPKLRRFVLVPFLINFLLFAGLIWFGVSQFSAFIDSMIPEWLSFLTFLLWPLFAITVLLFVFFTFSFVANFLAAPFNALLAQATEEFLQRQTTPEQTNWLVLIKAIPAMLWSEVLKLTYFIKWAIPILILFFIPGLNLLAPFCWAALSAWMLTVHYTDFSLSNHNKLFAQNRELLKKEKGVTLGFGAFISLLTMIPGLNFIAMPVAVTGATALCYREGFLRSGS